MNKTTLVDNLNAERAAEPGAIAECINDAAKAYGPLSSATAPVLSGGGRRRTGPRAACGQQDRGPWVATNNNGTPVPAACTTPEMLEVTLAAEQPNDNDYSERAEEAEAFGGQGLRRATGRYAPRRKWPLRRNRTNPPGLATPAEADHPLQNVDPVSRSNASI